MKPPPPPWEVLQQVGEMVGGQGMRQEVDKGLRALTQSALSRLEVVSREEFDIQADVLKRTRARVVALEAELAALTQEVEALTRNAGKE
tara:strand:+ start:3164 stop:3430 length:267 start_codon:yes stop_codon:yes gene_type:complete